MTPNGKEDIKEPKTYWFITFECNRSKQNMTSVSGGPFFNQSSCKRDLNKVNGFPEHTPWVIVFYKQMTKEEYDYYCLSIIKG